MLKRSEFTFSDVRAGLVVFLIALPLSLGIALASNAPLISGLIAGIVGGVFVGLLSGSHLAVTGPAAGLTVVVIASIATLGTYEKFLVAVILAGAFQIALAYIRAGDIAYFVPSCVIKGMTAAIGLILILKQIPHALGYDSIPQGDESFLQSNAENTFSSIVSSLSNISLGAALISITCLAVLVLYQHPKIKKSTFAAIIPGSLAAVIIGIAGNALFKTLGPEYVLDGDKLVALPVTSSVFDFFARFPRPDFSVITDVRVWTVAFSLSLVASLETLLGIEAIDKLDPQRRVTPTNRELKAQGVGNIISGLLGGLPLTAVIVRSSANLQAGATSKASAVLHGFMLFGAAVLLPGILNSIPLAALAAVLILTGWKLCSPKVAIETAKEGTSQVIPFVVTIVAVLLTDLLTGVLIGVGVGLFFVIKTNFHSSVTLVQHKDNYLLRLEKDVSFLNKAMLVKALGKIPNGAKVIIDGKRAEFIDHDILEAIEDFKQHAAVSNITVVTEDLETTDDEIALDMISEENEEAVRMLNGTVR